MNTLILFVALAAQAAAPKAELVSATAAPAAVAAVQALPEVQPAVAAAPHGVGVYPRPQPGTPTSFGDLLSRRFLSGPWSATRRLKAARLRGDEAEVRRMETTLSGLVDEAVGI